MAYVVDLGERIRAQRVAKGWSQADLAANVGVTLNVVGRWERSAAEPRLKQCKALAQVFGASLDWLVYGVGDPPPAETLEESGTEAA